MEKRKSASDTLLIFTAILSIKNYFKNSKHYCITDKPSYCKVFSKSANEVNTHTLTRYSASMNRDKQNKLRTSKYHLESSEFTFTQSWVQSVSLSIYYQHGIFACFCFNYSPRCNNKINEHTHTQNIFTNGTTYAHNHQPTNTLLISGSCFSRNILTITRSSTILRDE